MRRKPLTWAKTWVEPIICTHWWISQSHLLRYFPETFYITFHLRFIINLILCFFFNNLFRAVSIVSPGSSNPPGNPNLPSNLNKALLLFVCLKMVLPKMHVYEGIVRMLTPKFFFSPATIDNKKNSKSSGPPGKKHGVGSTSVFLLSGRLKKFLHVDAIVLHPSESFTRVAHTRPRRPQERQRSLHSGGKFAIGSNLSLFAWNWNTVQKHCLLLCRRMFFSVLQITLTKSYKSVN